MSYCINPNCKNPQNSDNQLFCSSCGSELLIQGTYHVVKLLGSGGFGNTYEINGGGETKVLKVLTHGAEKALELFKREAEILGKIDHQGVPKVDENGYFLYSPKNATEPLHCLIMQKIEGMNLRQYLEQKNNQPIDAITAKKWLKEILEILKVIHTQGLIHRDIKPDNIMLTSNGLVLIDFGAAKQDQETEFVTQTATVGTSLSSTGFTPKEQIEGQALKQSDFYALGKTFIYLLTGKEPNDSHIYNAIEDTTNWREFADSSINDNLANLINQMIERIPKNRPQSAEEIIDKLNTNTKLNNASVNPVNLPIDQYPQANYADNNQNQNIPLLTIETPNKLAEFKQKLTEFKQKLAKVSGISNLTKKQKIIGVSVLSVLLIGGFTIPSLLSSSSSNNDNTTEEPAPEPPIPKVYDINISIQFSQYKSDGSAWDFGAISPEIGGNITFSSETITFRGAEDSYTYTGTATEITLTKGDTISIQLYDVDTSENDYVGEGSFTFEGNDQELNVNGSTVNFTFNQY